MSSKDKTAGIPKTMRIVFGTIMILIYIGMGVLFLCGFFPWLKDGWAWLRWAGGILFIGYGIWRAYRQFTGIDPDITTRD